MACNLHSQMFRFSSPQFAETIRLGIAIVAGCSAWMFLSCKDTSQEDIPTDSAPSDTSSDLSSDVLGSDDSGGTDAEEWTGKIPPLHTEGREFKDPYGNTVVLRGVAVADPVDVFNRDTGMTMPELFDVLTDEDDGFYTRIVRLTVYPDIWLYNEDPTEVFENYYRPAVERAVELGLYIIIDWHEISDVETVRDRTTAFWEFMAPKFAGYTNVLYEIFNEPENFSDTSWELWKPYAQEWVDLIRESAPNNIILIGGPYWDQQIGGAATDPVKGENLAYVGHIYPPAAFMLLTDDSPIAEAAKERPVMITEWGYRPDEDPDGEYRESLKAWIEERGLSWTAWCADSVWSPVMFDEEWNLLTGADDMGGFVKEWLAERHDQDQPLGGPSSDADSDSDTDTDTDTDSDSDNGADSDSAVETDAGVSDCIESKIPETEGVTSFQFCIPESADALAEVTDILAPLGEDSYSYASAIPDTSICGSESAYLVDILGEPSMEIFCALSRLPYIDQIYALIPL